MLLTCTSKETCFANFEPRFRKYSVCFQSFFVSSSIEYAALGGGWVWVLLCSQRHKHQRHKSSRDRRLLVIGGLIAYFVIAMSSIGFLKAGLELERLQSLFLQVRGSNFQKCISVADLKKVFVFSTTFLLCLVQFIKLVYEFWPESNDRIARSNGQASIHALSKGSQNTPPSRKAEPNSQTWDREVANLYAESVSGGEQTYWPLGNASSVPLKSLVPSTPLINSTPLPTIIDCALANYGRISVDSEENGVDDLQAGQLWSDIKAQRKAKHEEAVTAGRWIHRGIRARCCKCNGQIIFLHEYG